MKYTKIWVRGFTLALALVCALCSVSAAWLVSAAGEEPARLPIILYHQFNPTPSSWGEFTISPSALEEDLRYLSEHGYTAVTTRQLIDYADGRGELPDKPVLLTIDDGEESFLPYALPLFEEYGMSAVLSILGKYADQYTEQEDHNVRYSHFSWPALAGLQTSPAVELASHTYDMHGLKGRQGCRIKPGESAEAYRAVLSADLERVEERFLTYLGRRPDVFAYPYGFVCTEAREVLRQRGYRVLFTCQQKVNLLTGDPEELLDLGRYNRPSGVSSAEFFKKIGL